MRAKLVPHTLGAMAAAALAIPAQGREVRLEPTGDSSWVAYHAQEKCRIGRFFGEGDDRYLLLFDQFEPGPKVAFTAAGPDMQRFTGLRDVELQLHPLYDDPITIRSPRADMGELGEALTIPKLAIDTYRDVESDEQDRVYEVSALPQIDTEAVGDSPSLSLTRRNHTITFELAGFAVALKALNDCSLNLVGSWGLDVDSHLSMSRMAEPINFKELADHITKTYPRTALRIGEQATLVLRIIVDADGSIDSCLITGVTATQYLRSPACDVFGDRAMFAPAEDEAGHPIKSFYTATIVYSIN